MATPTFRPVQLRIDRALEHHAELKRLAKEFWESDPYELAYKFDPHPTEPMPPEVDPSQGQHLWRMVEKTPIPERVSLIAGDVFKEFRSALDYVAWQLALAKSDSPPETTAFPIFRREENYVRDKKRFIGGIDPAIYPIFDSVQPYHAGDAADDHPLWVLHRMANDDKHKVPHVVGSLPHGIAITPSEPVDVWIALKTGPFESGDVVARVGMIDAAQRNVAYKAEFNVTVAFGPETPARGRPLALEIHRIAGEVEAAIERFYPFFPDAP